MLRDNDKTSTLWKAYKGFGSTHSKRETFEELYHSFKNISSSSVLTYGDLLPTKKTDLYYEEISSLDSTNPILYHEESSFNNKVPFVKKVIELDLTPISSNCDHAFAILDINGKQIKNIIPYDYSDEGLYDYKLTDCFGNEIPFGLCDWVVDTNSSLLTFNNGVPENVDSLKPPKLTFFQYVGPVGERHYIDVVSLDVKNIGFEKGNPVKKITKEVEEKLNEIEKGFFAKNKFNGSDLTEGLGLQYNVLLGAVDSETGDYLKGYDDNSNSQVTHLLSHKVAASSEVEVLFVSEGVRNGDLKIQVEEITGETGAPTGNIHKVNTEDGFLIVDGKPGSYSVVVRESQDVYAALLVKDNTTGDLELFYPRDEKDVNLKATVFVDLMKLPPHLKLESLSSYSDSITPQYYGPRTVDFVVASDEGSVNFKSADYVVYNAGKNWFSDAMDAVQGTHVLLRSGLYKNASKECELKVGLFLEGEYKKNTIIRDAILSLESDTFLENLTLENCEVQIKGSTTLKNCKLLNTKTVCKEPDANVTLIDCDLEGLETSSKNTLINTRVLSITADEKSSINLLNSSVVDTLESKGLVECYSSFIDNLVSNSGEILINASKINTLDATNVKETSIVDSTNIKFVKNLPEYVKIDSSYVTEFSKAIRRPVYPDDNTIPYYNSFKQRVYAKTPKPFYYKEKTNELVLLLDSIENTIFVNKKGELQVRFFNANEISLNDPGAVKTQIEEVYGEHGDTILSKEKPEKVEEAILDLYWAKADLKNGKVPIDQLPDTVAYGGLTFVGMWSFEDHDGAYPTFTDTNKEFSSDDAYTDLQNGWFFIVSASHKEDDPCYPQYAVDGEEFTAGDWVIFSGGHLRKIDFTKAVTYLCGYYEVTSKGDGVFTVKNNKNPTKIYTSSSDSTEDSTEDDSTEPSFDDSVESSTEDSVEPIKVGTFKINKELVISEISDPWIAQALGIELGQLITDVKSLKVKNATYLQTSSKENPWQKLDRAYLDPVYSRLPEYATVTGDENPHWSIEDGGTGLLRLSFLSLSEALRLINEALFKLSPDNPCSIRTLKVVIDEEKTTAKKRNYIPVGEGELDDYLKLEEESQWDSGSGSIYFKQEGIHDSLPLEHCFYCGKESQINVYDGDLDITDNCKIERFDPYEKYRLGFRAPTVMDGAEVTGCVKLGKFPDYIKSHSVKYSQYKVEKVSQVTDAKEVFEGDTKSFDFEERKFYGFDDYEIDYCKDKDTNLSILNMEMQNHKVGGYGLISNGTELTSGFVIENFTKYGSVDKGAGVVVEAEFNGKPLPVEVYSKMLVLKERDREIYDLHVFFVTKIHTDLKDETGTLIVKAKAENFGVESSMVNVLKIKDLKVSDVDLIPEVVEGGQVSWPEFGNDPDTNFGAPYTFKNPVAHPELVWEGESNPGFGWPEKETYLNKIISIAPGQENYKYDSVSKGIVMQDGYYRFVTFKKELDSVMDLCGFFIDLDWVNAPEINPVDSTLDGVTIQVCATSNEDKHEVLMDGNKPIGSAFFVANMEAGEACNYPGKSSVNRRRISFGRKPVPVKDIYVRLGIRENSGIKLRNLSIDSNLD